MLMLLGVSGSHKWTEQEKMCIYALCSVCMCTSFIHPSMYILKSMCLHWQFHFKSSITGLTLVYLVPFLMLLNLALIIFHIFTYWTNPSVYNKTSVTVTITVLSFMDSLFLEYGLHLSMLDYHSFPSLDTLSIILGFLLPVPPNLVEAFLTFPWHPELGLLSMGTLSLDCDILPQPRPTYR